MVLAGASSQERKANRAPFGKVKDNQCSVHQSERYAAAVRYFIAVSSFLFGFVSHDVHELDDQVNYFIELVWEEGEPKWLIGDLLSGISYFLFESS